MKFLNKLNPHEHERLLSTLDILLDNPYQGKALVGPLKGRYSWRIGNYRIIYRIIDNQLHLLVLTNDKGSKVYK